MTGGAGIPEGVDAGGDAACWLGLLCPDCGAVREPATAAECWRCGAALPRDRDSP